MENLSNERIKADIIDRLYRIKRIVSNFQHAVSIDYRCRGEEDFYRYFIHTLEVEIGRLKIFFNEEGGEK